MIYLKSIGRAAICVSIFLIIIFSACKKSPNQQNSKYSFYYPDQVLGELFYQVQLAGIFPDQKTFVDCVPLDDPSIIVEKFNKGKGHAHFDLEAFVLDNFKLPEEPNLAITSQRRDIETHLQGLWNHLTRDADSVFENSTLIPLPEPYIVPGGRFREVFYWDSYFTILGLAVSNRADLIKNMLNNFAWLIDTVGFIPNGNRTYFISRSQPPFFAPMVMEYSRISSLDSAIKYLPYLEKEYAFWMKGYDRLLCRGDAGKRVVRLSEDVILNRYWDTNNGPRIEAYAREHSLASNLSAEDSLQFHKHIRAACESGWDFSSRWFADGKTMGTIQTAYLLPVDQNCLLYFLEKSIAELAGYSGMNAKQMKYEILAKNRRVAILNYFWDEDSGFFYDYNYKDTCLSTIKTLAACMPLYFNIATQEQANRVATVIKEEFLKEGGVVTTLQQTGEQWDYPNGWAPLQWITVKGLSNYGHEVLAAEIASRWMALNERVFFEEGKMMEKYNVVNIHLEGGGGKYPNQDGFGWTNGIYLKLLSEGHTSE
ncbi:MAG TPA: trehalase [Bacteroidales bacterium]|jgi:alpha,alpha-trehalase|nr:trehalase [Bacteroidales bacterium]